MLERQARLGLVALSLLLLGLAVGAWIGDTPATVSSTVENSTKTVTPGGTPSSTSTTKDPPSTATTPAEQRTTTTASGPTTEANTKTTEVVKGPASKAKTAAPDGSGPHKPSDSLLLTLLGFSGLAFVLGAVGRVPTKISKDGFELAEAVKTVTDEAKKEQIDQDPQKMDLVWAEFARRLSDYPDTDPLLQAKHAVRRVTSEGDDPLTTSPGDV